MKSSFWQERGFRAFTWLSIAVLALAYLVAAFVVQPTNVQAAQVTSRSITLASSEEDAETDYTFEFTIEAGSTIGAVRIEFCDDDPLPHETCGFTAVGDDIPQVDANAGSIATESGTDAFAFSGAAGNCADPALNAPAVGDRHLDIVCTTSTETFAGATTFSGTVNDIDNPSNGTDSPNNPNNTFYARVYVYNTITPPAIANPITTTNVIHTGGVAMSTAEQLTVTARVAEVLEFCVGTNGTAPADCTTMSGNSVDLGVLDFASINRSTTETPASQGSILIRTNASGGVIVGYFAEQDNGDGKLKVAGTACTDNTSTSDQCINSVGTTQAEIVAGTEEFGLCIFNIDTSSSTGGTTTTNLAAENDYDGACDNTAGNGYAFDDTGTFDQIANSTNTVVNDEMLEIDFAGTTDIATPSGLYSTTLTFIGTSTF